MSSLTQPLDFRKLMQSAPKPGFDIVPFLDAVIIAAFIGLNASAFIIAPGADIQLPASTVFLTSQASPTAVLTVDRNELIFFEGDKLSSRTLEARLQDYIEGQGAAAPEAGTTLLIKADTSLSTGVLFNLMDLARKVGFDRVHLAAEADASAPAFAETP